MFVLIFASLIACCFASLPVLDFKDGSCPTFNPSANFTPTEICGKWFVISNSEAGPPQENCCKCGEITYKEESDNKIGSEHNGDFKDTHMTVTFYHQDDYLVVYGCIPKDGKHADVALVLNKSKTAPMSASIKEILHTTGITQFHDFPNQFSFYIVLCASCTEGFSIDSPAEDESTESVSVWTGQNMTLSCDENEKHLAQFHRLWRKGPALISASTVIIILDHRFRIVNEHVLTLNNVTRLDEGEYSCEIIADPPVKKKYSVTVVEVICGDPDPISNGFMDPNPGTVETFRYGDEIIYSCQDGYILIGKSVRQCLHPETGWDGDSPKCEIKEVAEVNVRMSKLENKLQTQT
uniref:Sushi domain-containing protein n=1 Tax=Strigamia maritima TaxID=126957 RepID=T1IHA5_STRMM